jgi:CDP-paratose 2-epimerase
MATLRGRRLDVTHATWRTGDQRYYVSNTSKLSAATGWQPKVNVVDGVRRLHDWLVQTHGDATRPSALADEHAATSTHTILGAAR